MYPDSEIKEKYRIANAPDTQVRDVKPLDEVRIIDPATGSGNFLYYAFDLFYDLYMDQIDNYDAEYDEDDIPKLILENNLHGIDIDGRAVQIAQMGLYIKAMQKSRGVCIEKFNVVSSDFFLPEYEEVKDVFEQEWVEQETKDLIRDSWEDLRQAYKFGSLVKTAKIEEKANLEISKLEKMKKIAKGSSFSVDKFREKWENWKETVIPQLHKAVGEHGVKTGDSFLGIKTKDAISFLTILNIRYDVAVANPPYTDSSDFGPELKGFIGKNYMKPYKFHTNLYASFINRCAELIDGNGKLAMIHPLTFMYIKTFEGVRQYILEKFHINVFVDYSADATNLFDGAFASAPAFYVLEKGIKTSEDAWFISLNQYTRTPQEKYKKDYTLTALDNYIADKDDVNNYCIPQSKLKIIKSWPFIYWISDGFRENFGNRSIESYFEVNEGLKTGKNEKYFRFNWEVKQNTISKTHNCPIYKGGAFCKWYGNLWLIIDYINQKKNIEKEKSHSFSGYGNYMKEGVICSSVGTKNASFRINYDSIFSNADLGIYIKESINISIDNYYCLGLLNSKLVTFINTMLNPTVNITVGDIKRIPFEKPSQKNMKS